MTRRATGRQLLAGLTVLLISAGCADGASPALVPAATPGPTTTPASTPTAPPASQAPTIGLPADDGARIIAVETNPLYGPVPVTRARDITIDSPAVGIVQVQLLLPGRFDADPETRWPVLYVLGGASGTHLSWTQQTDIEALTAPANLLVVIPDVGAEIGGGWYSDWWNGGKGGPPMWETFHVVELPQLLERNWHAGDKRAIEGPSMGGVGAIGYAERHPGMFLFAGSWSAPLDLFFSIEWMTVPFELWGDRVAQADVWRAHDPMTNAAALRGTTLYVAYGNGELGPFDSGPDNPFGPGERVYGIESAAFVQRLAELNIPVTVYAYGPGTHTTPYIVRDLHESFPLVLKALGL